MVVCGVDWECVPKLISFFIELWNCCNKGIFFLLYTSFRWTGAEKGLTSLREDILHTINR